MAARAVHVLGARIDGIRLDLHRATLVPKTDARGRPRWELTGWTGPVDAALRRRLVVDETAVVEVETSSGRITGQGVVSLMAVSDATGSRTFVRVLSTSVADVQGAAGANAAGVPSAGAAGGPDPARKRGRPGSARPGV